MVSRDGISLLRIFACGLALSALALAQIQPDWRRIGNTSVEAGLASVAGGPVDRVWYSPDGARLFVRTLAGRVFETSDFESWQASNERPAAPRNVAGSTLSLPEAGARVHDAAGSRLAYALGRAVYRSEDDGANWRNLTEFRGQSLVGGPLADLAVSPRDAEEIVVSSALGVWRSLDGGLSWTGLNEGLPNLPIRKLVRLPGNGSAVRVELESTESPVEAVWAPGERTAWAVAPATTGEPDRLLRAALSTELGATVTSAAAAGDFLYAGGEQGRIWVSPDRGETWRATRAGEGTVESIWTSAANPRLALVALQTAGADGLWRVARTINGGLFWDDLTANLPPGSAHAVTADLATGAVYLAGGAGVFLTYADLVGAGPATQWTSLQSRLPRGAARDVRLDEGGNQLFVALEGHGVFAALAPHRFRDPRIVNAADYSSRAAAPGALLSVLGTRVSQARAGELELPVLAATEAESQIQVPFEATGSSLDLALMAAAADGAITRREWALALRATSPAIFIDRDGMPMVLDADRGVLLDAGTPARAGSRIQILASGLGRVAPDWPTGLAAPLENPPRVLAPVRVFVDRTPVEVTSATLAPGYVGFYVIEVRLPAIVNSGPAELYIDAGGQASGRVSLMLAQ